MSQEVARSIKGGVVKLRVSSLPFSEIPGQSRLFLEYLKDPLSLKRYYPNTVASFNSVEEFIPEVLANYTTDRNVLCDALSEINTQIGAGPSTFDGIELLREPDSVAVVTGQQAGLFTGPLYTIYKALSAVKMAEQLSGNGAKAVPVFWAATEDHDFDEVSRAFFLDQDGALLKAEYEPSMLPGAHRLGPSNLMTPSTGLSSGSLPVCHVLRRPTRPAAL